MNPKYCYCSVCDGPYGVMMERCVRTARQAGVFMEFHVLTDRPLEGCECYDAFQFDKAHGLFKLHYLKVGMSRLNFDYFVWLDADTVFVRKPADVLAPLNRSPIHVPLEVNLSTLRGDHPWNGTSAFRLRDLLRGEGIANDVYLCGSAFWIVHHDAIDAVYELALGFWHRAKEAGLLSDVSVALGYAMQMLCANPERHFLKCHPNLWATRDSREFQTTPPDGQPWSWRHPLGNESVEMRPAIVHLTNGPATSVQIVVTPLNRG